MPRSKTPSFVAELPLILVGDDERQLIVRLDCARQIYNAVLGAALTRLGLLRQSNACQAALGLPKRTYDQRRARAAAFQDLNGQFQLREFDLHSYAVQCSQS